MEQTFVPTNSFEQKGSVPIDNTASSQTWSIIFSGTVFLERQNISQLRNTVQVTVPEGTATTRISIHQQIMKDLSSLQQTLQVAFSLAEASTIIERVSASPAQNAAVQAHESERVQAYLQRRHEAMRTIEEFTRRQQEFLPRYAGLYVAFYQGRVVDSDVNRAALAQRFYARYGNVPVCIAKPGETPETIRLVTPHLKKS